MAKMTIEDLVAAKERPNKNRTSVFLPGLDGELEVVKIPLPRYMNFVGGIDPNDPAGMVQAQYDLIYACCPILHDGQLQEAYECHEPNEIVEKVFRDNMDDMNRMVAAISGLYGVKPEEDLKN